MKGTIVMGLGEGFCSRSSSHIFYRRFGRQLILRIGHLARHSHSHAYLSSISISPSPSPSPPLLPPPPLPLFCTHIHIISLITSTTTFLFYGDNGLCSVFNKQGETAVALYPFVYFLPPSPIRSSHTHFSFLLLTLLLSPPLPPPLSCSFTSNIYHSSKPNHWTQVFLSGYWSHAHIYDIVYMASKSLCIFSITFSEGVGGRGRERRERRERGEVRGERVRWA